jgi:hypothetical protein
VAQQRLRPGACTRAPASGASRLPRTVHTLRWSSGLRPAKSRQFTHGRPDSRALATAAARSLALGGPVWRVR